MYGRLMLTLEVFVDDKCYHIWNTYGSVMGFIPNNGWFIREIPLNWMMTGGTHILGNHHVMIYKQPVIGVPSSQGTLRPLSAPGIRGFDGSNKKAQKALGMPSCRALLGC